MLRSSHTYRGACNTHCCSKMNLSSTVTFSISGSFGAPRTVSPFERKNALLIKSCDHNNRSQCGRTILRMRYGKSTSRRAFNLLSLSSLAVGFLIQHRVPQVAEAVSSPFATPEDLTQRLKARITKEPLPKLYQSDIFYPDYFAGTWRTESALLSVACPAGYKLFGRPGSFEAAQEEVNKPLEYQTRFIRLGNAVISDREFNVSSIAKASMGTSSVLDCTSAGTPQNRLTMALRPNAADGAVFNVDLRVIARQQQTGAIPSNLESRFVVERREIVDSNSEEGETSSEFGLYTSETMRQEVRPNTDDLRVMPLIKDVETTTLFVTDPRVATCIRGWQKTSVYLTKSDLRYPDARGRPIDVRWYRLTYFKD